MNPLKEEKSVVPNFDENSFRALDFSLLNPKLHGIDWRKDILSYSLRRISLHIYYKLLGPSIKDIRNEEKGGIWPADVGVKAKCGRPHNV